MNRHQRRLTSKQNRKRNTVSLDIVLSTAIALHREGRLTEAEQNYQAILKAIPQQPDACHYLGLLKHQQGQSQEGIELILLALKISPNYTDAYNNLGNVYKEVGDLQKSAECYRKVLELVPEYGPAFNNLGVVLRNLGDYEAAVESLQKAIALEPENYDYYQNLGNAYRKLGDYTKSAEALRKSIALQPYQADAYKGLWRTHYLAREFEAATDVLKQWLQFDPSNPIALHTLASHLGDGNNIPSRASDDYVQQTFDSFAGSFDQVLQNLDYRAPQLVASAVSELYQAKADLVILDAGCGTGLCGPLLKPYAAKLIGIDLSSKMLAKASGRMIYDDLITIELVSYLTQQNVVYNLIVSADTLVYFGDLKAFLLASKLALLSRGHVIFTVEKCHEEKDFKLNVHGRYSHSQRYLEDLLNELGFNICSIKDVILRKEAGSPVSGFLVTATID